jgi:hypothetical protein
MIHKEFSRGTEITHHKSSHVVASISLAQTVRSIYCGSAAYHLAPIGAIMIEQFEKFGWADFKSNANG